MRKYIAICDDEEVQLEYIKHLVDGWAKARNELVLVETFPSAEAFLFAFDEDKRYDILLLDIQMGGMDGMTLAEKLRAMDGRIQIVFITAIPDFMARGYDVDALHYLLKPVAETKLIDILDRAVAKLGKSPKTVMLTVDGGQMRVPVDDILYAEAFSHTVDLYLLEKICRVKITMNELESLLGEGFFRCHRSYIVNMGHVRRVTRMVMVLDGGKEIPLSRKLYDEANQAFIQCC